MQDDQIKHMANRFLGWKLPASFGPDGGISFKRLRNEGTAFEAANEPVGTNLLGATEAEAMVRYLVEGLPPTALPEVNPEWEAKAKIFRDEVRAKAAVDGDGGIEPEATLTMLQRWTADAQPANEHGQVSFTRAMLESAEDSLTVLLAEKAALSAKLAAIEALLKTTETVGA